MKLTIAIVAAQIVLRFTVPENASFWLVSTQDHHAYRVECAGHVLVPSECVYRVSCDESHRFYEVWME